MNLNIWLNFIYFLAYERLVYTRQCVEEAENANANACLSDEWFNDNDNPNIRMMSCETCTEEDGCNREIKNYFVTEVQSSHGNNFRSTVAPKTIFCLLIIFIYSYCKLWMRKRLSSFAVRISLHISKANRVLCNRTSYIILLLKPQLVECHQRTHVVYSINWKENYWVTNIVHKQMSSLKEFEF